MSAPVGWPTLDEFKKLVDLGPDDHDFDTTAQRQLDAAIEIVKHEVGTWDEIIDVPDAQLSGAALRAAFLLSLKENPAAIVRDQVFATFMHGKHRRWSLA